MRNIKIEFNGGIIDKMRALNLQTDQVGSILFILFALYENRIDLLDKFDDNNKERRTILLYRLLERRELISQLEEEAPIHYTLTDKGIRLIDYIKTQFDKEVHAETFVEATEKPNKPVKQGDEGEDWMYEFVALWPPGVHSGKHFRTNPAECVKRLKEFMQIYPEYADKDIIMKAGKMYTEGQEAPYQYTMKCVNFILKSESRGPGPKVSELAAVCESVIANKGKEDQFDTSWLDTV